MKPLLALALATAAAAQSPHLGELRQLTHGGQNVGAYWSPDGTRLVFQSTREPYGCDQIFVMGADGSQPRLISTGKGRTTCAYFMPDGKRILTPPPTKPGRRAPPTPTAARATSGASSPASTFTLPRSTARS